MTTPPWDPHALMRPVEPPVGPGIRVLAMIDGLEFDAVEKNDTAIVIWHRQPSGLQPLVWMMRLHTHNDNCGRA